MLARDPAGLHEQPRPLGRMAGEVAVELDERDASR